MAKKNKKQANYFLFSGLFIFLVLVIIISFLTGFQEQEKTEKWISVDFNKSKTITIKSTLPISDELGKKLDGKGTQEGIQGYTELTIKNNLSRETDYEIYVEKIDSNNEISSNYIKFYLADEADNPLEGYGQNAIPTYNDLSVIKDAPTMRLLYSGRLEKEETQKIILRSWLSDSYVVSNDERDFVFNIVVKTK